MTDALFDPSIEDGPDTIKILLTTDNHIGYKENDPIRCDDSWKTFNEIIVNAKDKDVDMIIHGGDLFDTNKPSKTSMFRVMEVLRSHCFGDKPCELELMSDFSQRHSQVFPVNYEDPNINVSIPIFGINGNHDDATGSTLLLPMDVLSVAGLVNMFGAVEDSNKITLSPILLQKGSTKFALYGLSHVKDDRLFRLFQEGNVKFLRPSLQTDDWFNMFCAHQNHVAYSSTKGYLPEQVLPDFLDFIYWGHEHECNTVPNFNQPKKFHTLLPGSSIVTSLSESETSPKHVFILRVNGRRFSLEPIPLKTVRPFLMDNVSLAEEGLEVGFTNLISAFLCEYVEDMIKRSKDDFIRRNSSSDLDEEEVEILKKDCPLPLIRLRVDVTGGYEVENLQRLSRKFVGKVANSDDVFIIHKRSVARNKVPLEKENNEINDIEKLVTLKSVIDDFVANSNFYLLPDVGLNNSMDKFIEKDDRGAISDYIKQEVKRGTKKLLEMQVDNDLKYENVDPKVAFKALISKLNEAHKDGKLHHTVDLGDDDSEEELIEKPAVTKRTPRRTKAPTANKKSQAIVSDSESSDDMAYEEIRSDDDSDVEIISEDEEPKNATSTRSTRGRGKGRGRGRGATSTRARGGRAPNKAQHNDTKKPSLLDSLMNMGSG